VLRKAEIACCLVGLEVLLVAGGIKEGKRYGRGEQVK
jgi:hypothetical protein